MTLIVVYVLLCSDLVLFVCDAVSNSVGEDSVVWIEISILAKINRS